MTSNLLYHGNAMLQWSSRCQEHELPSALSKTLQTRARPADTRRLSPKKAVREVNPFIMQQFTLQRHSVSPLSFSMILIIGRSTSIVSLQHHISLSLKRCPLPEQRQTGDNVRESVQRELFFNKEKTTEIHFQPETSIHKT